MKIAIIGIGWFGLPLAQRLKDRHEVIGTTRTLEHKTEAFKLIALNYPATPSVELLDQDVVVLNIPPFEQQLTWFQQWDWSKTKHVIFISSTSAYGAHQLQVNEETLPEPDTASGKWLVEQENWFLKNVSSTVVRFGGLIGGTRHPGKHLSGKKNLAGANHPVNLLEREDALNFIEQIIETKPEHHLFNLIHPDHPTRAEFYGSYCLREGLALPEFKPDTSTGKQINSVRTPEFFEFRFKRLDQK